MPPSAGRRPPEVGRVLRRVTATARRHAMFDPGGRRVLVAVSGGPDSLCLLHALVRLRRLFRIETVAFHFDHRLREGSDRDAAYVRRQAAALQVPFVLRTATSRPGRGQSVEAWARVERYGALAHVAAEVGAQVAATGHTADDQAETVLLAALRGGGIEALSAMDPVGRRGGDGPTLVRPLLDVTRDETHAFCRALRLRPRRDPMNADTSFLRVALRRRAIPTLERELGRNVRASLVRTADLLRQDAALLEEMAREAAGPVVSAEGGGIRIQAAGLLALPPALASRVIVRALRSCGASPDADHVRSILDLAEGGAGRRISLPEGLIARRDREYVRFSRPSPERRR
jgi:tRNA(Ile)-lysidine synthase